MRIIPATWNSFSQVVHTRAQKARTLLAYMPDAGTYLEPKWPMKSAPLLAIDSVTFPSKGKLSFFEPGWAHISVHEVCVCLLQSRPERSVGNQWGSIPLMWAQVKPT